jgi:non-specific serine/threonine protein kinase/serine/threonine-protein kinase
MSTKLASIAIRREEDVVEARRQARIAAEAQRSAERRFAEVRKLANALLFDYHDAIKDLPGSTPVRERLVRDALDYLKRLADEAGEDASLQMELALAYRKVAEVQGGSTKASLGDSRGALESLRTSSAILEKLVARAPHDRATRRALVEVSADLTQLFLETGDAEQALSLARQASADAESLLAGVPPDSDFRDSLARTYDALGAIQLEAGKVDEALAVHRKQLALLEAAALAERGEPRLRRALSYAQQHLADAQFAAGDLDGALASYRRCLVERQALSAEEPLNIAYRNLVASAHFYEGDILSRMGRTREALEAFLRSAAIGEELSAADPRAYGAGPAFSLMQIGAMLTKLGKTGEAATYFRRALAIHRSSAAEDPGSLWKRAAVVDGEARLCGALAALGSSEAPSDCAVAVETIGATSVDPENASIRTYFAINYAMLGDAYAKLGEDEGSTSVPGRTATRTAREMYRRSLDLWTDLAARSALAPDDAEKPAEVGRALARIEAALGN